MGRTPHSLGRRGPGARPLRGPNPVLTSTYVRTEDYVGKGTTGTRPRS